MNKHPLISTLKKEEVKRDVTFVLKSQSDSMSSKSYKREICNQFHTINNNLNKRLEVIANISKFYPVRLNVNLTSPAWPLFNDDISEVFNQLVDPTNLRILVNFEDVNLESLNNSILGSQKISHLVEVSFQDDRNHDLNDFESPSSSVYVSSVKKAVRIIGDIMFDIAMYYTVLDNSRISDIESRRNFSYAKVNLIKKENLKSEDWNVKRNKGYIALAGYFWDGRDFKYKEYLELWESIAKDFKSPSGIMETPDINSQLKRHIEYGELPINKILKKYSILDKGEYFLVRVIKIPKRIKTQASLLVLLGGSKLKRGKIRIFEMNKLVLFKNYNNYVSIFKITK